MSTSSSSPIVQYWHAAAPPDQILELTHTFAGLNPERPHLLFDARTGGEFIASHFSSRESAAFDACGPAAMQADYLRYCTLLQLGGVWADAGFRCVRNVTPLLDGAGRGRLFRAFVSEDLLMNGLMAFSTPGHPFLRLALDLATGLIESRWRGKVNQVTGPFVITAIWRWNELGDADAFIRDASEQERLSGFAGLGRYARDICERVDDRSRVAAACREIQVSPAIDRRRWVANPRVSLAHRSADDHWARIGARIYTDSPARD